jgi:hypothetical protein
MKAADVGEVVAVVVAVHGQQIRLFDDADLKLDRGHQQEKSRECHQVRCH